jgi:hypothetical protein
MQFFYQRGSVTTSVPWGRPDPNKISKFVKIALPLIAQRNLQGWAAGACLFDTNTTWDFDVWFTGSIDDLQSFENFMHDLYHIALNNCNLLIDLKWVADVKNVQHDPVLGYVHRSVEFIEIGYGKKTGTSSDFELDQRLVTKYYTPITEWLVKGNFADRPIPSTHIHKIQSDGQFKTIKLQEYIN